MCDCSTFLKLLSNKCLCPQGWAFEARHGITLVTFRIRLERTTAPMRLRTPSQLVVRSLTRRRKIFERATAQSSVPLAQFDSHAFIITKCDASPTRWKTVTDLQTLIDFVHRFPQKAFDLTNYECFRQLFQDSQSGEWSVRRQSSATADGQTSN